MKPIVHTAAHTAVRTECDGDVLVIIIDNPPINAGSLEVRRGLLQAIDTLQTAPGLQAGVLIGSGNTFMAGSDLREFGIPLGPPELPTVIAAIEACSRPVVAALHGAALGGGFELALGCEARVAASGTVVGLPEVGLGIIPGAGGTQRVPRRVGVARAIQMTCSGERIPSGNALALRLIDEVVDTDLRSAAIAHARSLAGRKCRIRDEEVPEDNPAAIESAEQTALRAGKHRPAVVAAVEAIRASLQLPIDDALADERAVFQQLRRSAEAFALRHQFFAEREAMKLTQAVMTAPRPVQSVAVIGAGTMGSGIAISALDAGLDVLLLEQDEAALRRGREWIGEHYSTRVASGKLKAGAAQDNESRLTPSTDWAQLRRADLVILIKNSCAQRGVATSATLRGRINGKDEGEADEHRRKVLARAGREMAGANYGDAASCDPIRPQTPESGALCPRRGTTTGRPGCHFFLPAP
jgi:3-hydroxyacyl-CoA dehydrogenase